MRASIKWEGGMLFTGEAPSGHKVKMDASEKIGGKDSAPRPMELVLLALGGCTAMDVISILRKKRKDVASLQIDLQAQQDDEYPRKFRSVNLTYRLAGKDLDEASVKRAIELSDKKYCSVAATLRVPVTVDWDMQVEQKSNET